ncbi:hypothetical protein KUC_0031 [Vreelandella boliviensis LC1]|uniref:Uncharacterized protein n=1 Tax=Vreelandella boliviensis LC1 TaxID=1072583 RepID=A0A7U9C3Y3_9GAMM|nr:hypothetical protein KUC_0031 [Halomonas boliviensis LC1]
MTKRDRHAPLAMTPHLPSREALYLPLSLRGAQRRGNLNGRRQEPPRLLHYVRNDKTRSPRSARDDTSPPIARSTLPPPVIARSEATRQSERAAARNPEIASLRSQ